MLSLVCSSYFASIRIEANTTTQTVQLEIPKAIVVNKEGIPVPTNHVVVNTAVPKEEKPKFTILELLSYLATAVGAIYGIGTHAVIPMWNLYQRLKKNFESMEKIALSLENFEKVAPNLQNLEKIAHQLSPNGGSSLYDSIKRLEIMVSRADGQHKALINSLHVVRFESDANGNYLWVSSAYEELTGISLLQAKDNGWITCIHNDDREATINGWQEATKQRREFRQRYRVYNLKDNSEHNILCVAVPLLSNGMVIGYSGVITPLEGPYAEKYKHILKSIR